MEAVWAEFKQVFPGKDETAFQKWLTERERSINFNKQELEKELQGFIPVDESTIASEPVAIPTQVVHVPSNIPHKDLILRTIEYILDKALMILGIVFILARGISSRAAKSILRSRRQPRSSNEAEHVYIQALVAQEYMPPILPSSQKFHRVFNYSELRPQEKNALIRRIMDKVDDALSKYQPTPNESIDDLILKFSRLSLKDPVETPSSKGRAFKPKKRRTRKRRSKKSIREDV